MDRNLFSVKDPLRLVMEMIDDAASAFRNRGHSRQQAVDQAALALGVTPRKAKAWLYGESFKATEEEARAVRLRYLDHLDAEAESLAERSEAIRSRRRQISLEL
jgi:hypothetical protein